MRTATGFPEDDAELLAKLFQAPIDVCAAALVEGKGSVAKAKEILSKKGYKEMAQFTASDVMKLRE